MQYDVIVAGAGPVGLMLACELRLHHVSVLVLERLTQPDLTIKAGSITTPTAEALDRRGLLPAIADAQRHALEQITAFTRARAPDAGTARDQKLPPRFIGHFAGLMLRGDRLDESDPALQGHGPAASIGLVPQQEIERMLGERALALGAEIRRGAELVDFEACDAGVAVTLASGDVERGRWLVGCDGGRSRVRKMAGFDFPGTDPEITGHQAVVDMRGAEGLQVGWNRTPTGVYVHGPVPGRILTVEFDGPPADRESPITLQELETSLRTVSGVNVHITAVRSATRFTDNARQASTYRLGRVLLAGDAAHVHSPFGGQGLNLGIGDALNLGWKLAGAVQGWAPAGLLDTYTTERHPIGAWVLDWTRAQVALMRLDPHAGALRNIVADLLNTRTGTTYAVTQLSGVLQHYELADEYPLVGRSAPDLMLDDGRRLADLMHPGRGVLLDCSGLDVDVSGWNDRVNYARAAFAEPTQLAALLVRPDGFVAWAADRVDEQRDPRAALQRWFGARR